MILQIIFKIYVAIIIIKPELFILQKHSIPLNQNI